MDLNLSDEQEWLAESLDALLTKQRAGASAWRALVEFVGDEGLGAVELVLVGRAMGRHLGAVPFLDSAAARYAGVPLAAGEAAALCVLEPGGGWAPERPATALSADGRLRGVKTLVNHGAGADVLVVVAADGERRIATLPGDAAGVRVTPVDGIDPTIPLGAVELRDAGPAEAADADVDRLLAVAGLLAAAEAVGAAGRLLGLARDYAATRRQFGRTIGSFQALRHLLADMHVRHDSAWSTVLFAAASLDEELDDAHRTAAIAKAWGSRATLEVAQGALQVFGGVAFTAEHEAHRYLRRILLRGQQFGDAAHHERALGRDLTHQSARANGEDPWGTG